MAKREPELVSSAAGLGAVVATETGGELGELEEIRARGYWELVWRRFRRDKVAIASGFMIILLIAIAFGGAPIAKHYVGHGPTDIFSFPPVVSYKTDRLGRISGSLLPANPGTHFINPQTNKRDILLLGAANRLGQDEFLRLLYGARVSL